MIVNAALHLILLTAVSILSTVEIKKIKRSVNVSVFCMIKVWEKNKAEKLIVL